jgi:hypothetical protein
MTEDMEAPMCEICGEAEASLKLEEAATCDDCLADACREALLPLLGKRCCFPVRQRCGELAICIATYGVEHDHCV